MIVSLLISFAGVDVEALRESFRNNPNGVRFSDLAKACDEIFGAPRRAKGSHRVYRMPWPGDPRVNIQSHKGMAKPYQVRQALRAMEKLEGLSD